jgi:Concanavalin A-like lectin/glucanases superfamily
MSIRYKGAVLSTVAPTTSTSVAPGLWTLNQQLQAQNGSGWPIASDPYFEYVSLLLTGDGTNGAQNNTFLDSSTNNFTITRNGNTTQGSFSPYGNLWSNYFDGSGDSLKNTSAGTAFQTGTGNFTIEFWANTPQTVNSFGVIFETYVGTTGQILAIQSNNSSNAAIYVENGNIRITTSVNPFDGKWHHHAIVRNGSTVTYYIDGTSAGTYSTIINVTTGNSFTIGAYSQSSFDYNGYISNFRFVKGTAVYTTSFTPPTTPLTAISGTQLLTCQSNRFIDNSSNNFTLTVSGTPSVQRFSPFNPVSPYSTSTTGGSGYFDSTSGTYLRIPNNSAFTLGNIFTVECWLYKTTSADGTIVGRWYAATNSAWLLHIFGGKAAFGIGTGSYSDKGATTIPQNTWVHIAVSNDATSKRIYVNGVLDGTFASDDIATLGSLDLAICQNTDATGGSGLPGYISNLRVVKGTAVYTSNFTPPTSPVTAISGTSLLTNFTNAGIPDAAMQNDLETVGNAQVSTAQYKFGGSSMYFDGSGDYIFASAKGANFNYGTGNFTIEFWVYPLSGPVSTYNPAFYTNSGDGDWSDSGYGIRIHHQNVLFGNNQQINFATAVTNNVWTHIALVRNGNTITAYLNGISNGSISYTGGAALGSNNAQPALAISDGIYSGGREFLNGYIDDLRITKGYARYTANFTPPTAPFYTY